MQSRDQFMASIEWEAKKKNGHLSSKDVTVTINAKKKNLNIYFRNGVKAHFPNGVKFGIYKNRIIFEPDASGYKISTSSSNRADYGFVSAVVGDIEKYKDWVGDYNLVWDTFYEFWYIERKEG